MPRIIQVLIFLFVAICGSSALDCYICQTWYNPMPSNYSSLWDKIKQADNADCKAGKSTTTGKDCDDCIYQDATITVQSTTGESTSVKLYQRNCLKASFIKDYAKSTIPKNKCIDASGNKDDPIAKFGYTALQNLIDSLRLFGSGSSNSSISIAGISCMCNNADKCNNREPTISKGNDLQSSSALMSVLTLASVLVSCKLAFS